MPIASVNFEQLAAQVGPDRLHLGAGTRSLFRVDGSMPAAVVQPAEAKELAEVVSWARTFRAGLIPATSGAYLPVGNPPHAADLAVSLTRLNRVVHYDPGDLTLGVEAGVSLASVQEMLGRDGLFLPADPPYADRAALGGLVAANASGPLRFGYGTWRDFVVGMRFVTGEEKFVQSGGRVVKNVAGYDLAKLMIGAVGSLGILTEINFKVFPLPRATAAYVFGFESAQPALAARLRLVHSVWQPRALELLDPQAAGLAAAAALPSAYWVLVVSVGGVDAVLHRYQVDFSALAHEVRAAHFGVVREDDERRLWESLYNLLPRLRETHPATMVVKAALPLTQVGPFIEKSLAVAARYELPAAASAHAGSGIAFIYLLPPAEMPDATRAAAGGPSRLAQAATEMIHAGNNLGGRVTIPWCPTEVKRDVNVWGPLRDDFPLMKKLKAQFDPDRVLNPGRFVGGL